MTAPRPRIDVQREAPIREAYRPVHGHGKPEIASSFIGLRIEAAVRARCPMENVKGDRPSEDSE